MRGELLHPLHTLSRAPGTWSAAGGRILRPVVARTAQNHEQRSGAGKPRKSRGAAPGATWASSPPRHAAAPSRAAVQLGGRRPEPRRRTHAGLSAVSVLACCCCRLHLALQPDRAERLWSCRAWPCPPHTPCRLTAASSTRVLLQALAFLPELSPKQPVVNKNQLAVLSMWICGIPC